MKISPCVVVFVLVICQEGAGGVKRRKLIGGKLRKRQGDVWTTWTPIKEDINLVDIDEVYDEDEDEGVGEVESKEVVPSDQQLAQYAYHHHHQYHHHPLYEKYEHMRPLNFAKLFPMAALVGLYTMTPVHLKVRRRRGATEEPVQSRKRYEDCLYRVACRVQQLTRQAEVKYTLQYNPLVDQLMKTEKFKHEVDQLLEEGDVCDITGCSDLAITHRR